MRSPVDSSSDTSEAWLWVVVWTFALLPAIALLINHLLFPNPLRDYSFCNMTRLMSLLTFYWPTLVCLTVLGLAALVANLRQRQWMRPILLGVSTLLAISIWAGFDHAVATPTPDLPGERTIFCTLA